jgi:hypothetical protein
MPFWHDALGIIHDLIIFKNTIVSGITNININLSLQSIFLPFMGEDTMLLVGWFADFRKTWLFPDSRQREMRQILENANKAVHHNVVSSSKTGNKTNRYHHHLHSQPIHSFPSFKKQQNSSKKSVTCEQAVTLFC